MLIDVENLSIERDRFILRDVNWQVNAGERWVILGANGSGKTSLLKVLAGYFPPSCGEVTVLGKRFGRYDWSELRKRIGFVSSAIQHRIEDNEPAVDVVVSGKYAQVNYWGRIFKKDRARAVELMESLNCGYLKDKLWRVLSQGERQRLLIARALMAKVELLVLDEPCAGLDPVARERFLKSVEQLLAEHAGLPVILVTHHVEEITEGYTHVLLLREGQVLDRGLLKRVLTSKQLSACFGAEVSLRKQGGRYRLGV